MKLFKHQQEVVDNCPDKFGLFFDVGVGKTATSIRIACKKSKTALVIVPKSLCEQWVSEIEKWNNSDTKFDVISKETFKRDWDKLPYYDEILIDEAHLAFANYKSQIFKSLKGGFVQKINKETLKKEKKLIKGYCKKHNPKCIRPLTATPYTSTCWSVFSLGKLIDKDWEYKKWEKMFFKKVQMGFTFKFGRRIPRLIPVQKKGIEDAIAGVVKNIGYVIKLSDIRDVPEQEYVTEYFDLTSEQKKLIAENFDPAPIVQYTRQHQLESGCLKGDGYRENLVVDCEKTNRLIELCEEHKKIIIVARYNLQLDYYKSVLIKSFPNRTIDIINGDTKNRDEIVNKHNNAESQILLVNSMCSAGYNLPLIPVMVFASMDYSFVNKYQMEGRIQRINNIKVNKYIYFITRGSSIDKAVYDCVSKKEDFNIAIYKK